MISYLVVDQHSYRQQYDRLRNRAPIRPISLGETEWLALHLSLTPCLLFSTWRYDGWPVYVASDDGRLPENRPDCNR